MASNIHGQVPLRPKGSPKCATHKDQDVIYVCKTCNDLICATCVIDDHKAHINSFVEIRVIGNEKKEILQNFIKDTENNKLPQLNQLVESSEKKADENARQFQELAAKMKQQNEKCKQELDSLTAEYVSTCDKMEKINFDLIKNHTAELKRRHGVLVDPTKKCKQVLQSGTNISVFDTAAEIENVGAENQELHVPPLRSANFIPAKDLVKQLKKALGTLVTSDNQSKTKNQISGTGQLLGQSTPTRQQTLPNKQKHPLPANPDRSPTNSTSYKLLEQPKELTYIFHSVNFEYISSLCPLPNGRGWVSQGKSNTISLLHVNGETMQTINHHCYVQDISLSPKNGYLWFCCYVDFSINEVSPTSESPVRRFTTEDDPMCLCVTNEGRVVVGTWGTWGVQHKVTVYTEDGVVLYRTTGKEAGMGRPERITVCPVTGNIAIVSKDNDGSHIIVFDKTLQQKFQYKGEDLPCAERYKAVLKFMPVSVQYDSYGNVVIGDTGRRRVELISGTGKYVKTLCVPDDKNRWTSMTAIGIQKRNILWMCCGRYITQIQYYIDTDL